MRLLRILVATVLVALGGVVASPAAGACACGAAPMPGDSRTRVTGEVGLVVWDGTTERIDLSMTLSGTTPDAGWVMPAPVGTVLALGDDKAFGRLDTATAPRPVTRLDWRPRLPLGGSSAPSGAAPGGAHIEAVTDVGPFRVTTLSGGSASSVNDWLRDNAYATRDELLPTFQSYLDQGWRIQAVKLVPGANQAYRGVLPPLRMTFGTTAPVYPLRLSRHAAGSQRVRVYVAAPHRMDVLTQPSRATPLGLRYAGVLGPETTGLDRPMFVTAYEATLSPDGIVDDITWRQAARDEPFARTYVVLDHTPGTFLGVGLLLLVLGGLLAGLVHLVRRLADRR